MAMLLAAPTARAQAAADVPVQLVKLESGGLSPLDLPLSRVLGGSVTLKLTAKEQQSPTVTVRSPDSSGAWVARAKCQPPASDSIVLAKEGACADAARVLRSTAGARLEIRSSDGKRGADLVVAAAPELAATAVSSPAMVADGGLWESAPSDALEALSKKGGTALVKAGTGFVALKVPAKPEQPKPVGACVDNRKPLDPQQHMVQCFKLIGAHEQTDGRVRVCVDATDPQLPRYCAPKLDKLREAEKTPFGEACADPTEIPPNQPLDVFVIHREGWVPEVDPGGPAGSVSVIWGGGTPRAEKSDKDKTLGGPPDCRGDFPAQRFEFHPRPNEFLELKIKLEEKAEKPTEITITKPLRVKRAFRVALRTGIGATYSPLDRKYEARASGNPNNPGKEVVVAAGDGAGIGNAELMLGVSWFSEDVDSNEYRPVFSMFAGLGVFSAGKTGVDAFTSLVAGPELSLGKDFSFALIAGVRRTEVLEGDLKDGSALPAGVDNVPTVFSVTPTFGLMINLSPYVFSKPGST
ncbi:MAG: hypothetical protein IPM79_28090 [Polyangiaceae bacterium]|nr:hypothetical protein [Polyangiaceae bacterium]MBK8941363.1 hypothetical protein [Polyangiaceae bacterium]